MNRLSVTFMGCEMKNPVISASGTFGYGSSYSHYFDPSILGAVSSKGITLHAKDGNSGIRIYETPSGVLNSIGLQNPGIREFTDSYLPLMKELGCAVIVNLGGNTLEEYAQAALILNDCDFDILELNISCPNVKEGGMAFGIREDDVFEAVKTVRDVYSGKLMVKMSPNAQDIVSASLAAQQAGADGLSMVNTFQAMAVDVSGRKAVFDNVYAGLSGPAIMPVALRMVHQTAKAVKIPVCGAGGIASAEDALAFLMAGASAVQIGSSVFGNPNVYEQVISGLNDYCEQNNLDNISEIIGIV